MRPVQMSLQAPAASKMRSLARENAATRRSTAASAASARGGLGSSTATVRPTACRAEGAASNAATQAPTGPPPTTITSNASATSAQSGKCKAASKPRRRTAKACAQPRECAFCRRRKIKQQQPKVAQHAHAGSSITEELDEPVGKANNAVAITCTPPRVLRQKLRRTRIIGARGQQLSQHRGIAQT